jgi:hypothetical protein
METCEIVKRPAIKALAGPETSEIVKRPARIHASQIAPVSCPALFHCHALTSLETCGQVHSLVRRPARSLRDLRSKALAGPETSEIINTNILYHDFLSNSGDEDRPSAHMIKRGWLFTALYSINF